MKDPAVHLTNLGEDDPSEAQETTPSGSESPGDSIDAALDRALSGDSRAFLKANRQTGGQ